MITDEDRAAIEAHVDRLEVGRWRGLDSTEADLLKRALAPARPAEPSSAA